MDFLKKTITFYIFNTIYIKSFGFYEKIHNRKFYRKS